MYTYNYHIHTIVYIPRLCDLSQVWTSRPSDHSILDPTRGTEKLPGVQRCASWRGSKPGYGKKKSILPYILFIYPNHPIKNTIYV